MDAYIGLESGGTKLAAALMGADGAVVEFQVFPREPGADARATLAALEAAALGLAALGKRSGAEVRGVGFGFGGYVRRSTQAPALCLHEPGWETGGVRDRLQAALALPVAVENDCKVAALAESHLGAGAESETVFYVTLGTGVGGGIVRRRAIVEFGDLGEAEIGHLVVVPDGPPCWCGGRGCLEAVCSGPGIVQLARWLAGREPGLWAADPLAQGIRLTSHGLVASWEAGQPFATLVLDHAANYLAGALGVAATLINPDVIVVGGGFGLSSKRLLELVGERLPGRVAPAFRGRAGVAPARLGDRVVSLGAALLARHRHIAGTPQI